MSAVVLFREDATTKEEYNICSSVFPTYRYRSKVKHNELVIPRYSALPYYKELEFDLSTKNATLINSTIQHEWIANFNWYQFLKEYTPKTWTDEDIKDAPEDAMYVVKGKTNSRKLNWNTKMFADSRKKAINIGCDLLSDPLIAEQGLIYREYIPLKTFEVGINDLPFSDEWRFFFYKDTCISYGYYWSIAENIPEAPDQSIIDLADTVSKEITKTGWANFYVLDIAMKEDGKPILIEVNDGSMSGLQCIDPRKFYESLFKVFYE